MTKNEIIRLMEDIKVFYHNFSFPPDLVQAWYDRLNGMSYEQAKKNLDDYIATDEIGRMPTIAKIMRSNGSHGVDYNEAYRSSMRLVRKIDSETYMDDKGLLWAYPAQ